MPRQLLRTLLNEDGSVTCILRKFENCGCAYISIYTVNFWYAYLQVHVHLQAHAPKSMFMHDVSLFILKTAATVDVGFHFQQRK